MTDRCLRGHHYAETGFYRDPATGAVTCIACQEPMDIALRPKGPRPGVVEPLTRSQRYYYRNREQRVRDAVEAKRRRRAVSA